MILSICIAIFLPTLLGFFIIAVILGNDEETPLGERIGLSFPLGAGILTLQIFLLGLLRIPLTLFSTTVPLCVELFLFAIWIWRKKILLTPPPRPASGLYAEFSSPKNHWMKKCAFAILALWIGAKLGSIFLLTGLRPIYAWDAWDNWSAGAKVFFSSHSLLLDAPAPDFFGKNAVDRIIVYPLHNNLLQVWMSLWIGKFDDVFVKFSSPTYLLSMAICFYYITAREINRLCALAVLAIVLSSPMLSYHSIELYGDLMLGIYLFFASASFLKAMRGNISYWILTGLYSAEALFTKQEAFFFVLPLLLSAILYLGSDTKKNPRLFSHISLLLIPFLLVIPWYAFTLYYGLGWGKQLDWLLSIGTQAFGVDHLFAFHPDILIYYFYSLLSLNNFNVIFFFFPILLVAQRKLPKEFLHLLFPVICYMLFFLTLYLITEYSIVFSLCFDRNALTFYPSICLLTVVLLKKFVTIPPPSA